VGFLKKLKKRTQRLERVAKAKDAKRDARAAREMQLTAKHRENEINAMEQEAWDDMQVIFYTALHEQNGFGGKRLTSLFAWVQNLAECVRDDYVTEKGLLDNLAQETRYVMKIEPIDPHDDRKIRARAIDRITLYFYWTLHAHFGFGYKRLHELQCACGSIGHDMLGGARTIHGMTKRLQGIRGFWLEMRD